MPSILSQRELIERLIAQGDVDAVLALMEEIASQAEAEKQRSVEFQQQADDLRDDVRRLHAQVKYLTRLLYGRRSEKLSLEELGQLVLAYDGQVVPGQEPTIPAPPPPTEEHAEPSGDNSPKPPTKKPKKRRPNHKGRMSLSPELERIVVAETRVPEGQRDCQCCGHEMTFISFVEHESVEFQPPKIIVHVERRETLVCKASGCRKDATTAERQHPPAVRTRIGASLLAHLIESKCDDAQPLDRQHDQLARLGFEVPVNTLYSNWAYATNLLLPVSDATLGRVLADGIVGLDDTGINVLDRRKSQGRFRGHFWCFIGTSPLVAYSFTETWKAEEVAPWISAIDGFIQCDDYKGYGAHVRCPDGVKRVLVPPERRLGCCMHVRRRFYTAFKLGDERAAEPIRLIRDIYAIEEMAKNERLNPSQRLALRTEKSLPLLDAFDQWVDDMRFKVGQSSKMAKAVHYAFDQRPYVRRCFTDGRFELDTGRVERALRKPAIGRKNYLFAGSIDAAKRLAGAYTLVQSCRALGIPTRDYLIDVMTKIEAGFPMRRLVELVPDRWAEARGLLRTATGPLT